MRQESINSDRVHLYECVYLGGHCAHASKVMRALAREGPILKSSPTLGTPH